MKIVQLTKKRNIVYHDQEPLQEVYSNSSFNVFKLKIKNRLIPLEAGEVNFMINLNDNPNKYIILYCFMEEPNTIFRFSYFINNEIKLENNQIVDSDPFVDTESSYFYVMDFITNYVSKHYKIT